MPRFYVFDTEENANTGCWLIEQRAREMYASEGYEIDADGGVIGVNVGTGQSEPDAQRTERYAIPQQRLDGLWVVPHPEQMPSADIERNGMAVKDYITQDLSEAVVEEFQPDWFPQPEPLPV